MSTTTTDEFVALLRQRIDNGIKLLDERGYCSESEIRELVIEMEHAEAAALDLNNCNRCVLAAVFDSYSEGLARLGINESDAVLFGFDLGRGSCDGFDELTWQWRLRLGLDKEDA